MTKRKEMNFPKTNNKFREKLLLKHFIKFWDANRSTNSKFKTKVFGEAEDFISKVYGEEWVDLITDSEKFYEFMDKEEEQNEWLEKACKELLEKEK